MNNDFLRQSDSEQQPNNGFTQQSDGEQQFNSYFNELQYQQAPHKTPKKGGGTKTLAVLSTVLVMAVCTVCGYFGGVYANSQAQQNSADDNSNGSANNSNVVYMSSNTSPVSEDESDALSVSEIAAMAADSVVEIVVQSTSDSGYIGQTILTGAGSGVILTQSGYIITNNHVVEDADSIKVRLRNGEEYDAELIGADSKSDIAVIKIDAENLTVAVVGDSSLLQVGELAVAIGNPLGELGGTVTDGIISALDREITIDGENMTLLQTNAAINPGNSGGGLFNGRGELIGIVNAKSSGTDIEGLGFAIPINDAMEVFNDLVEYGYVRGRVDTGMQMLEINDTQTAYMYRVSQLGLYVYEVENGSSAQSAGLQSGDYILSVDGTEISSLADFNSAIDAHSVGDQVEISVLRGRTVHDFTITLTEYIPDSAVV